MLAKSEPCSIVLYRDPSYSNDYMETRLIRLPSIGMGTLSGGWAVHYTKQAVHLSEPDKS